jgi:hypothetical protein
MAAPQWEDVSHAGAFLLGALLATVATLRIMRSVTNFFNGVRNRDAGGGTRVAPDRPPPGPPTQPPGEGD